MLRFFTDFNNRTKYGDCWNLIYEDSAVDEILVKRGDRVILFQDGDDFEVEATIDHRFVDELGRDSWVATPDWSTKKQTRL